MPDQQRPQNITDLSFVIYDDAITQGGIGGQDLPFVSVVLDHLQVFSYFDHPGIILFQVV